MVDDSFNRVLICMLVGLLFPLTLWAQPNQNIQRRQMSPPRVYIMGKDSVRFYGGVIDNKISLAFADGLKLDPDYGLYSTRRYMVKKESNGSTFILAVCEGGKFTPKVKEIFRKMRDGDKIVLSGILIDSSDGIARVLPPFDIEYRRKK